jgi:hypothetical protein
METRTIKEPTVPDIEWYDRLSVWQVLCHVPGVVSQPLDSDGQALLYTKQHSTTFPNSAIYPQ